VVGCVDLEEMDLGGTGRWDGGGGGTCSRLRPLISVKLGHHTTCGFFRGLGF